MADYRTDNIYKGWVNWYCLQVYLTTRSLKKFVFSSCRELTESEYPNLFKLPSSTSTCISFPALWQKTWDKSIFKEESFILIHRFKFFRLWSLGPFALGLWQYSTSWQECVLEKSCVPHSCQGDWKGFGSQHAFQGHTPYNLPPTGSHILNVSLPSNSVIGWGPRR
jgi:hypothetical protein